jgi:uncharacterized protein (TIGR02147 family)
LPDISQYVEYRKYLRDAYTAHKARDRRFSHRFISQKMNISSSGWFADIMARRQNLKARDLTPLSTLFKLDAREREFLRVLVQMEHAETSEERTSAHEKWLELKGIQKEKIAKDRFKYFEHWYYPILREILALEPFRGDYIALAAKIHPPISPNQAREAVQSLTRLGLLAAVSKTSVPILVKDTSTQPQHSHKLQLAYMEFAAPALQHFTKEQRDFSAITLSLSPESLKRAGEEISLLRSKLLALSERDPHKNRVYQCLFQVFPISDELSGV